MASRLVIFIVFFYYSKYMYEKCKEYGTQYKILARTNIVRFKINGFVASDFVSRGCNTKLCTPASQYRRSIRSCKPLFQTVFNYRRKQILPILHIAFLTGASRRSQSVKDL